MRLFLLFLVACGVDEGPTYSDDIRPLVKEHCASCHRDGGAAPFALSTYEEVASTAMLSLSAMEGGRMPPWSADPDCREVEDQRIMAPEDVALFRAWVDADTPPGEPTDAIAWEEPPFDATVMAAPMEAYTPSFEEGDNYRCQVLDAQFDTDVYVVGSQVFPGSPLVHHVLVYALVGEQVDRMRAADEADPGPGYACFGGPVPSGETRAGGLPTQIGGWVPGARPTTYPPDTALRIPAGAAVVMQVHYSAVVGEPEPDLTTFGVTLTEQQPAFLTGARPLPVMDLHIPAGASSVTASQTFTNWRTEPIVVRTSVGHMHLLGEEIRAEAHHLDGTDSCLLDVPDFDFEWQQGYRFVEDEWVELQPGDSVEVTCVYDNSVANQPTIKGVAVESQDVEWGDGTLDEMCLVYLGTVEPYSDVPDLTLPVCASLESCVESCEEDSFTCILECEDIDERCNSCALGTLASCVFESCPLQSLQAQECLVACGTETTVLGGAMGRCMRATCPDAYEALLECADDQLVQGTCDEALSECGL